MAIGASGRVDFWDGFFLHQEQDTDSPQGPRKPSRFQSTAASGTHALCDSAEWEVSPHTEGGCEALKEQREYSAHARLDARSCSIIPLREGPRESGHFPGKHPS